MYVCCVELGSSWRKRLARCACSHHWKTYAKAGETYHAKEFPWLIFPFRWRFLSGHTLSKINTYRTFEGHWIISVRHNDMHVLAHEMNRGLPFVYLTFPWRIMGTTEYFGKMQNNISNYVQIIYRFQKQMFKMLSIFGACLEQLIEYIFCLLGTPISPPQSSLSSPLQLSPKMNTNSMSPSATSQPSFIIPPSSPLFHFDDEGLPD